MSESCPSATRQRAERAARALRRLPDCAGVDVLDPNEGLRSRWTLEATFTVEYVPAAAGMIFDDHDCDIGPSGPRLPGTFHVIGLL